MGFFNKLLNMIASASLPTYKFENNKLQLKTDADNYYEYDLDEYDMKTRHDPFVLEAYTLTSKDIFIEYMKVDSNASWKGHALSLYESFFKEKLNVKQSETLEKKEMSNYVFQVIKINDSIVIHFIYIYTGNSNIIIVDMKGDLYQGLRIGFDKNYEYKYNNINRGEVNFNISMVKENCLRSFFGSND
jgi:hypothetical protein